jgi:hypothetical protein
LAIYLPIVEVVMSRVRRVSGGEAGLVLQMQYVLSVLEPRKQEQRTVGMSGSFICSPVYVWNRWMYGYPGDKPSYSDSHSNLLAVPSFLETPPNGGLSCTASLTSSSKGAVFAGQSPASTLSAAWQKPLLPTSSFGLIRPKPRLGSE